MAIDGLTPASIGDKKFTIPLYQRLFEWDEREVEQLMKDLYAGFQEAKPYYIGVLTVFEDKTHNRYALVDGQQRFTLLMLLGIVLEWRDFLFCKEELRLTFFARKNDEAYLYAKATQSEQGEGSTHTKMDKAIEVIRAFLVGKEDEFKTYLQKNTTFFLSVLPENYSPIELNRYFEAMNEAGKGLENHEILKVRLLRKLDGVNIDRCTQIWNLVAQMDKCLIRLKEKESKTDFKNRYFSTFENPNNLFTENESNSSENNEQPIKDIKASSDKPKNSPGDRDEGSLLDFQEFLLLVLALSVGDTEQIGFDKNKLLKTFEILDKKPEKTSVFFDNLLKYRLLFDYFVIRTTSTDGRTTTYTLNYADDVDNKPALIHYQSMLYVSTSYNIWLKPLMKKLDEMITSKNSASVLAFLREWDNDRHSIDSIPNFTYGSVDRYWFWRLDYYLWEKRDEFFGDNDKAKEIASQYVFRPNRSIEHVAPQTPKSTSSVRLEDDVLHIFGNLAMISAGQNSRLQNESYEVKKAHVASFINGSIGGTIESLKLLKLMQSETWKKDSIKKHHNEMIDILAQSFSQENIKKHLNDLKNHHP